MYDANQMDLFIEQNLNIVADVKREIRIALSKTHLSRDEVVDEMNTLAVRDGLKGTVTKAAIDGWCKDSDESRLPSLPRLVLFCRVLTTAAPIQAMVRPLGCEAIGPKEKKVLAWGQAELEKRRAIKKARLAMEVLENE